MKSIYQTFILSVLTLFISTGLNAQKASLDKQDLPKSAQSFLNKNFSNERLVFAERDYDDGKLDYEVKLSNGVKIEFDAKGNWKEVDARDDQALPEKFIPNNIVRHVKQNFAPHKISKIEKSRTKYEVELTNGLDLEFNLSGKFLRIDD